MAEDKTKCKGGWTICEDCRRKDYVEQQLFKPKTVWKGDKGSISCRGYLQRYSF